MTEIRNRREQDAFVEAVGQHDAIRIDAEECGRLHDRVGKVGISRQRLAVERAHRVHDLLRTAAGVLVQMQTQARSEIRNALDDRHWKFT